MAFTPDMLQLATEKLILLENANKNETVTDPLGKSCAEAESMVNDRTSGYGISADWHNRMVRAIAQFELWKNAGPIPPEVQKAYDQAIQDLNDIRDGKYPLLAQSDTGGSQARSGSNPKINPR